MKKLFLSFFVFVAYFSVSLKNALAETCAAPGLGGDPNAIYTGLGCIPFQPSRFVQWFLGWAISLGGGIAFLLMIWGVFSILTSSGDPEQLNKGKDIITSAIVGLLFIIFSIIILRIIGFDILKIPGFTP